MSYEPPLDFSQRVGQDVRLGELFLVAWRTFGRHWGRAVGCVLVVVAIMAGLTGLNYWLNNAVAHDLVTSFNVDKATAGLIGEFVAQVADVLEIGFLTSALIAGYYWSAVRTFDDRRMQVADLLTGFKGPRYVTLLVLGLLSGGAKMIASVLFLIAVYASTGGRASLVSLAVLLVSWAFMMLVLMVVAICFYLGPYFAMAHERPTVRMCLSYNWRVLKARPWHFLATFYSAMGSVGILTVIAAVPMIMTYWFLVKGSSGHETLGIVLLVCEGLIFAPLVGGVVLYSVFLTAAFFRSSYGYSLYPTPATAAPGGAGGAASSQDAGAGSTSS